MRVSTIPNRASGGAAQLLDQLCRTVWVFTGCVKQGFAEGVAVPLLADTRPLLPAHVLIFLLEVRAEPHEPRSSRGTAVVLQPEIERKKNKSVRGMPGRCHPVRLSVKNTNPFWGLQEL